MKRIDYIDTMRGFAIFLVTLGHVLEKSGYSDNELYSFIYSFHMPLFMCISGFVCAYVYKDKMSEDMNYKELFTIGMAFVWKKFRFIMIPYFVWGLIVMPFFFNPHIQPLDWVMYFRASCIENTSYWFLPCLFGLTITYPVYKALMKLGGG